MEDLAYAKVPDRLMHLFRRRASEHGNAPNNRRAPIGSTRETVSLELSHLVRAGCLRLDGKAFVLPREELTA